MKLQPSLGQQAQLNLVTSTVEKRAEEGRKKTLREIGGKLEMMVRAVGNVNVKVTVSNQALQGYRLKGIVREAVSESASEKLAA